MGLISTEEAVKELREYVMSEFPLSQLDNSQLHEQIKDLVAQRFAGQYMSIEQRLDIVEQIYSSIRGFGLLDSIMADDSITEVMVNGPNNIFIEQKGRVRKLEQTFESEKKLSDIIQRIVGMAGREVSQANPIVDTRLPDGSRVNVVLPPISLNGGAILTIRKFSKDPMTMEKLIGYGSITPEVASFLQTLVKARYNIFIAGGTGSGKTTFLNALSNYIPKDERIITIEDSAELQIENVPNLVSLESRNANNSGAGAITIRDLIKSSLRMRPDRIIVGEVRGAEALDMLQAMNTGHAVLKEWLQSKGIKNVELSMHFGFERENVMSENRKLKVYETSGRNYIPTPTIILKGKWLGKYGFDMNTLISVNCENGKIIIEPRDPDPIVVDEAIDGFLKTLSKKKLESLKRTLQSSQL